MSKKKVDTSGNNKIHNNYQGKALVATPMMSDDVFAKTVIYICSYDDEHALGVIINQPCGQVTADRAGKKRKFRLFNGGPVDNDKILVLTFAEHNPIGFDINPTLELYMNSQEFINDIMEGSVHEEFLLCKGCSMWNAGQLDAEVEEGSWLIVDIEFEDIFSKRKDKLWEKLIKKCGIKNPKMVVPYTGRA